MTHEEEGNRNLFLVLQIVIQLSTKMKSFSSNNKKSVKIKEEALKILVPFISKHRSQKLLLLTSKIYTIFNNILFINIINRWTIFPLHYHHQTGKLWLHFKFYTKDGANFSFAPITTKISQHKGWAIKNLTDKILFSLYLNLLGFLWPTL